MRGNPDSGGVWAPCLTYSDGQFWLIYSDVKVTGDTWKDTYNYLVTSDTIDGVWSEPIFLNGSGFDPSLFHDDDGKKWLVNMAWDHRTYMHRFYGIVLQEYDHKAKKLVGEKKIIYKGTDLGLTEAPHLYKINGYYYLLVAEGGTRYEHAAVFARSRHIWGPYETHPEPYMLTSYYHPQIELQKAGHASIVETQDGQWYMAHLTGRPIKPDWIMMLEDRGFCPLGRETAIQKLYWENDWPYVVGGNQPSVEVESPGYAEQKWERDYPVKDDFDSDRLNHHFQTLRVPFNQELGSLTERKGYLRLYGRESLNSLFTQSLVARRWQCLDFTAETKVEFCPTTFQQQAGLVCYYNTKNWTTFHITLNEQGQRVLDLMTSDRQTVSNPLGRGQIVIPEHVCGVYLRVVVTAKSYRFSYSFDDVDFVEVPIQFDSYKLSDDYIRETAFFTGAFVGIHCMDTSGMRQHADFDYFIYRENS